jgi:hypothetical protein
MTEHGRHAGIDRRGSEDSPDSVVTACETCPGRLVFTDEDNTDAWIATDLAVDVER